ncbi:MAG: hydrolase [Oscillospiraceae bacterium]|jgi:predicted hydrolase (HD superfamily)|nr:hydrolase [Oscillospiraceae bacterium]
MNITHAREILEKYNKEPFHLHHAEVVSGVMRYFAEQYDPNGSDKWAVVGLLHDIDFELYPDEHCVKGEELLRENGVDKSIIRSCMSHGYGLTDTPHKPEHIMEKILFAADELTGLIGAVAIMRPSRSVQDLELPSVKKKFKDKKFAAGCSRDVIAKGAEELGWTLDELVERTILAMRASEALQELPGAAVLL